MTIERTPENDRIFEEFLFHRGMILTCFAQVEWFLGKLLIEAHAHPEYASQNLSFSINIERRIKLLRRLFAASGPFHGFDDRVSAVLDELETYVEKRNFMAHGVLISALNPKHGIVFRLRMFKAFKGGEEAEGKMDFTLDQLIKETKAISTTTKRFIEVVREIANLHSLEVFYPKFEDEDE